MFLNIWLEVCLYENLYSLSYFPFSSDLVEKEVRNLSVEHAWIIWIWYRLRSMYTGHTSFMSSECCFFTLTTTWAFWEDYTCLDVSQCMLNKAILSVASKHLNSDMSSCQSQFLSLGTKVSHLTGTFRCKLHDSNEQRKKKLYSANVHS